MVNAAKSHAVRTGKLTCARTWSAIVSQRYATRHTYVGQGHYSAYERTFWAVSPSVTVFWRY